VGLCGPPWVERAVSKVGGKPPLPEGPMGVSGSTGRMRRSLVAAAFIRCAVMASSDSIPRGSNEMSDAGEPAFASRAGALLSVSYLSISVRIRSRSAKVSVTMGSMSAGMARRATDLPKVWPLASLARLSLQVVQCDLVGVISGSSIGACADLRDDAKGGGCGL